MQSFQAGYATIADTLKMINIKPVVLPSHDNRIDEGGERLRSSFKNKDINIDPLLTIITVVFNGAECLERTILNVINQSYKNIEYIIIDGGSTDQTLNIIRKYDSKINYWMSEPDKGIYDAMNKGWMVSNDDSLILFLGAGDQLLSLPEHIDNNKIIYGNVRIGHANKYYPSSHGWRLKLGNTLHHQALLVPKKFHLLPPFNLKYSIYADFDFNQRLHQSGYQFFYNDNFISYAEPDGVSANLNVDEMVSIVLKNIGLFFAILSFIYGTYQVYKLKFKKLKIN